MQTDMSLNVGIRCWRSSDIESDFDMCEQCIQWIMYNEMIQGDLGIGDLNELSKELDITGNSPYPDTLHAQSRINVHEVKR